MPHLPDAVAAPCAHPRDVLRGQTDWEIIAGRLGDELIACGREKEVAVRAYEAVRAAVGGRRAARQPEAKTSARGQS